MGIHLSTLWTSSLQVDEEMAGANQICLVTAWDDLYTIECVIDPKMP